MSSPGTRQGDVEISSFSGRLPRGVYTRQGQSAGNNVPHLIAGLVVLLVFLIPACYGCIPDSDISEEPDQSFLWEVNSDSNTVYLLGSIHAANDDIYPLDDKIENAFEECENVALEFDIAGVDMGELAGLLMQKAMYPSGETLFANIPRELYHKTDELLEEFGGDILLFNSYEPWLVAMQIEVLELTHYGYASENGIDLHFLNRAHEEQKTVYQLESAEYQLNLIDGLPEDLQILMLESVVNDRPTRNDLEALFDAWREGDVNRMEQYVFEGTEENPDLQLLNDILLDERNNAMANKIAGYLEDDSDYFVVVGAGHLVGEAGIPSLLKARNYSVSQL